MKYKISHKETKQEIVINFTIGVQTFSLYPIIKDITNNTNLYKAVNQHQIKFYKKSLKNALDNLIDNK